MPTGNGQAKTGDPPEAVSFPTSDTEHTNPHQCTPMFTFILSLCLCLGPSLLHTHSHTETRTQSHTQDKIFLKIDSNYKDGKKGGVLRNKGDPGECRCWPLEGESCCDVFISHTLWLLMAFEDIRVAKGPKCSHRVAPMHWIGLQLIR